VKTAPVRLLKPKAISRRVATIATLLLATAGLQPVSADDLNPIAPEFRDRVYTTQPSSHVESDPTKMWLTWGALAGVPMMPGQAYLKNETTQQFCEKFDSSCYQPGQTVRAHAHASFCSEKQQVPCIEKVEFRRAGSSQWSSGEFVNYWDQTPGPRTLELFRQQISGWSNFDRFRSVSLQKSWTGDARAGLVASAPGAMMIRAPGFEGASGSDTYLVEAFFMQVLENIRNDRPARVAWDNVVFSVRSIEEVPRADTHASVEFIYVSKSGTVHHVGAGVGGYRGEQLAVDGRSGFTAALDPSVEVRLTMRVPSSIGGWFHSRLSSPNISITGISPTVNRLVLTGGSTEVPITHAALKLFDPKNKKFLDRYFGGNESVALWRADEERGQGGLVGGFWDPNNADYALEDFSLWYPYFNKNADGKISVWSVARMPTQRLGNNRCMNRADRVQGLINTNAMVYQSLVPNYQKGFLNYQVAGVHYDPNGEIQRGEYDLLMRSEVARCLYGFSKAPVSATITISGEGDANIATTVVGEKNGWLRLAAYGFTFSKKTIKVKLTQKRQTTITCVAAGKKSVKVTAANPKCPKGYKKR
jgi:hypothetical protein